MESLVISRRTYFVITKQADLNDLNFTATETVYQSTKKKDGD
jgi:hypothetical protein